MKKIIVPALISFTLISSAKAAEDTKSLQSLLPAETVLVMAAPNYASAKKHFKGGASAQFWDSAEFKPFRKKLVNGFEENVLVRIEEECLHLNNQSTTFFHPVLAADACTSSAGAPASIHALYHNELTRWHASAMRRST